MIENDIRGNYEVRHAMISHFHADHMNGFYHLANRNRLFQKIYLPNLFQFHQHPNMFDMVLLESILREIQFPNNNGVSIWDFLTKLVDVTTGIELVARRDSFRFEDYRFDVLWPDIGDNNSPLIKHMFNRDEIPFIEQVYDYSDRISEIMIIWATNDGRNLQEIEVMLRAVSDQIREQIDRFRERLGRTNLYKLRKEINRTSIVCHSCIHGRKVLFTGDVTKDIIGSIKADLFDNYYLIKAPHHGTHNERNRNTRFYYDYHANNIDVENFMISNGPINYPAKRGQISDEYARNYRMVHTNHYTCTDHLICTNYRSERCKQWEEALMSTGLHPMTLGGLDYIDVMV